MLNNYTFVIYNRVYIYIYSIYEEFTYRLTGGWNV